MSVGPFDDGLLLTRTWWPTRPAEPRVCVVSLVTPNLLLPDAREPSGMLPYATFTTEQNLAWARAHGYAYTLVLRSLYNGSTTGSMRPGVVWSKPRAVGLLLSGELASCDFALHLDGDAVVHAVGASLAPLLTAYFARAATQALFASHGSMGVATRSLPNIRAVQQARQLCECMRVTATCNVSELAAIPASCTHVNSGVYAVRNSEHARRMLRWWADGGGEANECGLLRLGGWEQKCCELVRARWPQHVDVVHSLVLNAREDGSGLCLNSSNHYFVCHAYGVAGGARAAIFGAEFSVRKAELRALVAGRGEAYVPIEEVQRAVLATAGREASDA